jgi:hypothetical protein
VSPVFGNGFKSERMNEAIAEVFVYRAANSTREKFPDVEMRFT